MFMRLFSCICRNDVAEVSTNYNLQVELFYRIIYTEFIMIKGIRTSDTMLVIVDLLTVTIILAGGMQI